MIHNDEAFWKALETLVHESAITIDRPKDTAHPVFTDFIYPSIMAIYTTRIQQTMLNLISLLALLKKRSSTPLSTPLT